MIGACAEKEDRSSGPFFWPLDSLVFNDGAAATSVD